MAGSSHRSFAAYLHRTKPSRRQQARLQAA